MKDPICKKHPTSAIDNFLYNQNTNDYRCKFCRREIMHNNYLKNKEKIAIRVKAWRASHPGWRKKAATIEKKALLNTKQLKLKSLLSTVICNISKIRRLYEESQRS